MVIIDIIAILLAVLCFDAAMSIAMIFNVAVGWKGEFNQMNIKDTELYEAEMEAIRKELCELPESHLIKKGSYYYEVSGTEQKGITKEHQRIRQLARKAFLLQRLENLEWNHSITKKQYYRFKTEDPMEIIRGLHSIYKAMPVEYFFHPSVHDQMHKTEHTHNGNMIYIDGLRYIANSGILVRSKSERTIADALYRNRIAHKYEEEFTFGREKKCPDFTIYRASDGKVILWEHFGIENNEGYKKAVVEKMNLYARNGFLPFDNLICTYEQDLLNPAKIQKLIEMYLL